MGNVQSNAAPFGIGVAVAVAVAVGVGVTLTPVLVTVGAENCASTLLSSSLCTEYFTVFVSCGAKSSVHATTGSGLMIVAAGSNVNSSELFATTFGIVSSTV